MLELDSLDCLFSSDILIDKDLGLIRLIANKYTNCDNYFYKEIINTIVENPDAGKYILYNRKEQNPLSVISKEDVSDEVLTSLYVQFMDKHYDEIIDLAEPTDLIELIRKIYYTTGTVNATVLCSSEHEAEALSLYFDNFEISLRTIVSKYNEVNVDEYDAICIKDYVDVYRFKQFMGKTVIVSGAEYNYVSLPEYGYHELDPKISIYICNTNNELSKIDMYRTLDIDESIIEKLKEEEGD